MKVLVGYESRSGNTERAAKAIAAEAESLGHDVVCKPLADIRGHDVALAQVLFIGSWVKGFLIVGVGPAHKAMGYLESFSGLEGKQAGVFCTYALNPRGTLDKLRSFLASRGALVVGEKAFRGHGTETEGAEDFARGVLDAETKLRSSESV